MPTTIRIHHPSPWMILFRYAYTWRFQPGLHAVPQLGAIKPSAAADKIPRKVMGKGRLVTNATSHPFLCDR